MESIIKEIWAIIYPKIKNSKILWLMILGYLLYFLNLKFPIEYKILINTIKILLLIISHNIFYVLFITVIVISLFGLLKYSDSQKCEDFFNREPINSKHKSCTSRSLVIEIYENATLSILKPIRKILIKNNTDSEINYLKGQVDLYCLEERVKSLKFEINHLKPQRKELISKEEIDKFLHEWDEFDFYINDCTFVGDDTADVYNTRFDGDRFFLLPPNFLELSKITWIERKIPYNLEWLKEKCREVGLYLKWNLKKQTVYEKKVTKKTIRNIWKCRLKRFLIFVIGFVVISIVVFIIAKFSNLTLEIGKIITNYFIQLFERIFENFV